MIWAPLLHIYQPPTQFPQVLRKVAEESYVPLVSFLERNPKSKMTLNICASLTEQLARAGYHDVINGIRRLAERGQVELTGSAAYHPLLSRIPFSETSRQVHLNEEINREFFGGVYKPGGFFPPEMAYAKKVGDAVAELGYKWIILESCCASSQPVRYDRVYKLDGTELEVFFRHRDLSLAVAFGWITTAKEFVTRARKELGKEDYILTAMDGETFGHHRKGGFKVLEDLYANLESTTISDLLLRFPKREQTEPVESTWAASPEDCKRGTIYPRWDNAGSPLHPKQWELYRLALTVVGGYAHRVPMEMLDGQVKEHTTPGQRKWLKARNILDKALHSDQFWWASHNPYWHPILVKRGAKLLLDAILGTPERDTVAEQRARSLYQEITTEGVRLYGGKPVIG